MHSFEITVQRKFGSDWPVVALQEQSDGILPVRTEGFLKLDQVELEKCVNPKDYGTYLGRALFTEEIIRAFDRARRESNDRLHVLLFVEDDDLRSLHWERLCAPFEAKVWDYLSLNQRVPFSLYLPSTTDRRFRPLTRADLRMLILAASPRNLSRYALDEFDASAAVACLNAAVGTIPKDILASDEGAFGPPTLNVLTQRVTAASYPLLHVICHGQFTSDSKETLLYFANGEGEVDAVTGTRLIEELRRVGGTKGLPHFVFLSACEAGTPEADAAFGSLANRLVRELGIPAVVAMTGKVSVKTAELLSTAFYERLQEHGLVDLALVEAYAGLTDRQDVNVPALYSRLGGRPLFQTTAPDTLTLEKIENGLELLRGLLEDRAPVLRVEFADQAAALRSTFAAGTGPVNESQRQQALTEMSALSLDVLGLSFESVALGESPPPYDARCPFRGLYPFRSEDQEFFFGREALIEKLADKLRLNNFLAVLGPSGSGKSSVVLAGLVPAIQKFQNEPLLVYMTPGHEPLATLRAKLQSIKDTADVTLVVDQFEELFTHNVAAAEREQFLHLLLDQTQLKTVLTMRADFWGECAPHTRLKEQMQANQELIAAMNDAELRRAMELQAEKVGLRFEADLSSQILEDVQNEPGAMPLVQHALQELWKRRHGRWLRAHEYRELGGVRESIARTADEAYNKLSDKDKDQVREIFLRLTRLDDNDADGSDRRDTRQRVRLQRLVPAEGDLASTRALIKLLADARLLVTSLNVRTGQQEVEVAHEALIRHWPLLRQWLDRDREGLRTHKALTHTAEEWEQSGRDTSYLYEGVRLATAKKWAFNKLGSLNSVELEFLFASIIEEGAEINEWIQSYGNVERSLDIARSYLAATAIDRRIKGLNVLGSLLKLNGETGVAELLLKTIIEDESEEVRFRAAEILCEGGRSQWFVEQLRKRENREHLKRLIPAVSHSRNLRRYGLEVEQALIRTLPGRLRRSIRRSSTLRLISTYKAQFAIVLSFTFLAVEFTLQIVSRISFAVQDFLPAFERSAGLPYGTFDLIATMMCGLYALLRAHLDGQPITVRTCFRAAFWGAVISEAIFILGISLERLVSVMREGTHHLSGLTSILINSVDTLLAMMVVALVLRVITRPKLHWMRYVLLSASASLVALLWSHVISRIIFAPIFGSPISFNLELEFASILISWLLGISITLACFIGFREGLRTAFGSDPLQLFLFEESESQPEPVKATLPTVRETQPEM